MQAGNRNKLNSMADDIPFEHRFQLSVLAGRVSWCHLDIQNPQKSEIRTPNYLSDEFLEISISSK